MLMLIYCASLKKNYIFSNKRTGKVRTLSFIGKKLKNCGGLWSGCKGGPSLFGTLGKPPYWCPLGIAEVQVGWSLTWLLWLLLQDSLLISK